MQLCSQASGSTSSRRLRRTQTAERVSEREDASASTNVVLALVAFLACAACSPPSANAGAPDVTVGIRIQPSPPVQGPARVGFTLADSMGTPVEVRAVHVEANMDHAGMVPVLADAHPMGRGSFSADIEFTMGGDWYLLVEATLTDGRTLQRRIDVPGVRTP